MSFMTVTTRLLVAALATGLVAGCDTEAADAPNSSSNRIIGAQVDGGGDAPDPEDVEQGEGPEEEGPQGGDGDDPGQDCEDAERHAPEGDEGEWGEEDEGELPAPAEGEDEEGEYEEPEGGFGCDASGCECDEHEVGDEACPEPDWDVVLGVCEPQFETCIEGGDDEETCAQRFDDCVETELEAFEACGDGTEPELPEDEPGHEEAEVEPAEIEREDGEQICLVAQDLCLEAAGDAPELVDICVRAADNCMAGLDAGGHDLPHGAEVNEAEAACYAALDGCLGEEADPEGCFEAADDCLGD